MSDTLKPLIGTAANRPLLHRADRGAHRGRVHDSVRVNKDKKLA